MNRSVRFAYYVGRICDGRIIYVTNDNGDSEPGKKAKVFSEQHARERVIELMGYGAKDALIIMAPQKVTGRCLVNPREGKALDEMVIDALIGVGFKRWTRAKEDRLYINPCDIGLDVYYEPYDPYNGVAYRNRNIKSAKMCGNDIPPSLARDIMESKTYIDCVTGVVHSDHFLMKIRVSEILEETLRDFESAMERKGARDGKA